MTIAVDVTVTSSGLFNVSSTLTITSSKVADNGTYRCSVANAAASVEATTVVVVTGEHLVIFSFGHYIKGGSSTTAESVVRL